MCLDFLIGPRFYTAQNLSEPTLRVPSVIIPRIWLDSSVVILGNKVARIVWALLIKQEDYKAPVAAMA